ncbi:MAG: DNA-packaging protein [Rhizobiales bacterium]|nr:DNA-packaging protein [Hyphomicrobiales bacterium]
MARWWPFFARPDQLPPEGDWLVWLMLGGRGAGKTRAGAEWVRGQALGRWPFAGAPVGRIALVGETFADVREVMIEGVSGLLSIHERQERPEWQPSRRRVVWPNGSVAHAFSSEDPESLRGPQFAAAWADELAKWRHADATWDMLQFEELEGEMIEDRVDGLWQRADIERLRVDRAPGKLRRIVVAVDPPASQRSGTCGIVAVGLLDDTAYVLADATIAEVKPDQWAARALGLYRRIDADALVAEVNQGGDMVTAVMREIDRHVPVTAVRATRGKWLRAEPVAALYAQGRVRHGGALPELDDELCDFGPDGLSAGRSPDRLDALVWAVTALMLGNAGEPRMRDL